MRLRTKRTALLCGAALIALTFFYPPFNIQERLGAGAFGGFAWLWSIPSIELAVVAWPLLLVEWVAMALIAGLVWLAYRE